MVKPEINEILEWVEQHNRNTLVDIRKIAMDEQDFWFYDESSGAIVNRSRSFFSVTGIRYINGKETIEQPIIIQDEIGYLGILRRQKNGCIEYLMQAKIEPGNVNHIQISPTIQATKSNFTQRHGGRKPLYLDLFVCAKPCDIICDQVQSEQSSRFFKKRNRNIIVDISGKDVEVSPMHRWMTLDQIKELMKIDNLVNMDARTVLSCIPGEGRFNTSVFPLIYSFINNYKMFNASKTEIVPLYSLADWCFVNNEFVCKKNSPFKLIFADITIEGREVACWTQPLFEAVGTAVFGMFTSLGDNGREFLVSARPEIGSFDHIELGPTVQLESTDRPLNEVEALFMKKYEEKEGVLYNVVLSEEGGRFYHEQNRNIIIDVNKRDVPIIVGYFWIDFDTLSLLIQINNIVNIQARNLLSLVEGKWIN